MFPAATALAETDTPMPAPTWAAPPPRRTFVALTQHDPDLVDAVAPEDELIARRALTVPVREAPAGPLDLRSLELPRDAFALLVLEGELTCDIVVQDHSLTELLLPGDVLLPGEPDPVELDATRRIEALSPVTLALLDRRFLLASARWPGVMMTLQDRISDQRHRLAAHGAICQLSRVDDRLLAIMRHLAGRFGRVTAEGTMIPVRLTHEHLGRLVGARRPTVSLGLKELIDAGLVRRRDNGTWVLPTP